MSFIVGQHNGSMPSSDKDKPAGAGFAGLSNENDKMFGRFAGKNLLNPNVARGIFNEMDTSRDHRLSREELTQWIIESRAFPKLNKGDSKLTANRIFRDIDRDGNGSLDFNEFYKFIELVQREQQVLAYVNKHHLTCLPASVRVANTKEFSLPMLESMLHQKIQQLTSRDSDRYRQILTMFKNQVKRSAGKADDSTLSMTSRDFNTFLSMLGLFATREQASMLFSKFDVNNDGILTVHEFLTRAKAPDYPGISLDNKHFDFRRGRGKKIYTSTRHGIPVKAETPDPAIYDMGTDNIHERIRERLEQTAKTGTAFSDQKARRKLFRSFEVKDPGRMGRISVANFKDQLELGVGVVMGGAHMRALCSKYADENSMINYPKLVMEVYPVMQTPPTSLIRSTDIMEQRAKSSKPRFRETARNNVHVTGSYWATTPTNAEQGQPQRQGSGAGLPPLSASNSGINIRGITPMASPMASKRTSRPGSRVSAQSRSASAGIQ